MPERPDPSRRRFLACSLLAAAVAVPRLALAARVSLPRVRSLSLVHAETDERLSVVYWAAGRYEPQALGEVSFLLRDHSTDETVPVDPLLLDLLHDVRRRLRTRAPFAVLSGYRSPETNARLRQHNRRVAPHSLHLDGRAADVRLLGVDAPALHEAALELGRGGVGFYPGHAFVHLDTGPPRTW